MLEAIPLVARDSAAFGVLDLLADATNVILIVWLLAVLIVGTKRQVLNGKDWLVVALSIAVVYVVKTLDGKLHFWDRIHLNYSTHSALAITVVLALCFFDRPRRAVAIAVFVFYGVLQMLLGFHSLLDILTTLMVVVPMVLLCLRLITPRLRQAKTSEIEIS